MKVLFGFLTSMFLMLPLVVRAMAMDYDIVIQNGRVMMTDMHFEPDGS